MHSTIAATPSCIAWVLCLALAILSGPAAIAVDNPDADLSAANYDAKMRDFDTQMRNIVNTPVDFCDPAAVEANERAYFLARFQKLELQRRTEKVHPTLKQSVRAVVDDIDDAYADDFFWNFDPPIVKDYEAAMRRGDTAAANALQRKMTLWEQVKAADDRKDFVDEIKFLTPLADKGDANAQQRVAFMYAWGKTLDDAKIVALPAPAVRPPNNELLTFKYYRMAAANGDEASQEGLAKAYACGLGTGKIL